MPRGMFHATNLCMEDHRKSVVVNVLLFTLIAVLTDWKWVS